MTAAPAILVLGYGNAARGDDGLGPAFVESVAALGLPHVTARCADQLQIEDADDVARHAVTIFADARIDGAAPYDLTRLEPDSAAELDSHAVHPAALLAVARRVLGFSGDAYLLAIRGYEFEMFCESLSTRAARNLAAAVAFLRPQLIEGLADGAPETAVSPGRETGR